MKTNNFKALEEENEKRFEEKSEDIKNNVTGSLGFIKMIGSIFELFGPKIFSVIQYMTDNSTPKEKSDEQEIK